MGMKMKFLKKILQISIALLLTNIWNGCSKPANDRQMEAGEIQSRPNPGATKGGVVENRSRIQASVLEVIPVDSVRFYVRLRVIEADTIFGYQSFAQTGQEINAYPNFHRQEGQPMTYSSGHNEQMLQIRALEAGDRISAEVYFRGGSGVNNRWLLMDWQKE
jgi:hypothetical protein